MREQGLRDGKAGQQPQSMNEHYLDGWATGWLRYRTFMASPHDHGDLPFDEEPVIVFRGSLASHSGQIIARTKIKPNPSMIEGPSPFESRANLYREAAAG